MNWKKKLASRKFWAMVTGVVLCVCVIFGVKDVTTEQIIALVTAIGTLVAYIFSEASVDKKNIDCACKKGTE
jgi:multidrug efflux pump subunit AcrA (membrane-fusion protein)